MVRKIWFKWFEAWWKFGSSLMSSCCLDECICWLSFYSELGSGSSYLRSGWKVHLFDNSSVQRRVQTSGCSRWNLEVITSNHLLFWICVHLQCHLDVYIFEINHILSYFFLIHKMIWSIRKCFCIIVARVI